MSAIGAEGASALKSVKAYEASSSKSSLATGLVDELKKVSEL